MAVWASSAAALAAGMLALLSALHVYWAWGGKAGAAAALPEEPGLRFKPAGPATLAVAGALALAAVIMLLLGWKSWGAAGSLDALRVTLKVGALGMALVFGARAVGDFRVVGFFKQRRASRFARWDTLIYSPLCAVLAALALAATLA